VNEEVKTIEQEIFAQLNITKILLAILEVQKEITVPTSVMVSSNNQEEDKELQVDYNSDNQTFVFKLKDKNEQPE